MDNSISGTINEKLIELNMPRFHDLDKNIQEYLEKIEIALQKVEVERLDILKQYKLKKISIVNISKETKISRATMYNHKEVLERYIQANLERQEQNDIYCKQIL